MTNTKKNLKRKSLNPREGGSVVIDPKTNKPVKKAEDKANVN